MGQPRSPGSPRPHDKTLSHVHLHLSALNDFKKLYRNHHSHNSFSPEPGSGFTTPASAKPPLLPHVSLPCGHLAEKQAVPSAHVALEGRKRPRTGESGLPRAPVWPPQTPQGLLRGQVVSWHCLAPATYLPVQLAPAVQPGGVGGCVGQEAPSQPGGERGDPQRIISTQDQGRTRPLGSSTLG